VVLSQCPSKVALYYSAPDPPTRKANQVALRRCRASTNLAVSSRSTQIVVDQITFYRNCYTIKSQDYKFALHHSAKDLACRTPLLCADQYILDAAFGDICKLRCVVLLRRRRCSVSLSCQHLYPLYRRPWRQGKPLSCVVLLGWLHKSCEDLATQVQAPPSSRMHRGDRDGHCVEGTHMTAYVTSNVPTSVHTLHPLDISSIAKR
jgi:hypothetical protein